MSDEAAPVVTQGGSTAGIREAALAKREANKEAPSQAPQFVKKPAPAATAVADDAARTAHKKLPSREVVEDDEPDLSALVDDDEEPATEAAAPPSPLGETIKIGDFELPISVLEQLPDEALRRIKRKVKAGHDDIEVTVLDALESVPQAHGWRKRMWEAAQLEKRLQQTAQRMGQSPVDAIAELYGVPRKQAAEWLLDRSLASYDRENLSPEERQRLERQEALERDAAELKAYKEREQQTAQEREQAQYRSRFIPQMESALKAVGEQPTAEAIRRMSGLLKQLIADGVVKDAMTESELRWAAQETKKEIDAAMEQRWGSEEDGDRLIERVGEKRAKAIAKAYARRVARGREPVQRTASTPRQQPTAVKKKQTWGEFEREANARARARDKAAGRG